MTPLYEGRRRLKQSGLQNYITLGIQDLTTRTNLNEPSFSVRTGLDYRRNLNDYSRVIKHGSNSLRRPLEQSAPHIRIDAASDLSAAVWHLEMGADAAVAGLHSFAVIRRFFGCLRLLDEAGRPVLIQLSELLRPEDDIAGEGREWHRRVRLVGQRYMRLIGRIIPGCTGLEEFGPTGLEQRVLEFQDHSTLVAKGLYRPV